MNAFVALFGNKATPISLLFFLLPLSSCKVFSGSGSEKVISADCKSLKNSEVAWDGDIVGLRPMIVGDDAKRILDSKPNEAIPILIDALRDPDKTVVAHVLITKLSDVEYPVSSRYWNKLEVILNADGTSSYPNLNPELFYAMWRSWSENGRPAHGIFRQQTSSDPLR